MSKKLCQLVTRENAARRRTDVENAGCLSSMLQSLRRRRATPMRSTENAERCERARTCW